MRNMVMGGLIALGALGAVVAAQTNQVEQRFTFKVATQGKAGPSSDARLELVVNRWSTDAERESVLSALRASGAAKLTDAIQTQFAVGYMHWPGGVDYTLRYAYRLPRPDGGEDVIVGAGDPIRLWWESGTSTAASPQPVVVQLRVNKDGRGEGKLGTNVAADSGGKTIVLSDFATLPSLLTDVQRERSATTSSSSS